MNHNNIIWVFRPFRFLESPEDGATEEEYDRTHWEAFLNAIPYEFPDELYWPARNTRARVKDIVAQCALITNKYPGVFVAENGLLCVVLSSDLNSACPLITPEGYTPIEFATEFVQKLHTVPQQ